MVTNGDGRALEVPASAGDATRDAKRSVEKDSATSGPSDETCANISTCVADPARPSASFLASVTVFMRHF